VFPAAKAIPGVAVSPKHSPSPSSPSLDSFTRSPVASSLEQPMLTPYMLVRRQPKSWANRDSKYTDLLPEPVPGERKKEKKKKIPNGTLIMPGDFKYWSTTQGALLNNIKGKKKKVIYLGFHISQRQHPLDPEKEQAVYSVLIPFT